MLLLICKALLAFACLKLGTKIYTSFCFRRDIRLFFESSDINERQRDRLMRVVGAHESLYGFFLKLCVSSSTPAAEIYKYELDTTSREDVLLARQLNNHLYKLMWTDSYMDETKSLPKSDSHK